MALPRFDYSPFVSPLHALAAHDLKSLRSVEEGWYVDYKREITKPEAAAKALSSFANTYGGWIICGVEASGGGSPVPSAFPGIPAAEVPRLLEVLQRGASTCVQPTPFYETRTIVGPDAETGLAADRAVVVVRVPPGARAPYVHASGRIYRRVADSSEPRPETDRHVLDLLWERSRATRDRWADIIEQEFVLSEGEGDQPMAHFFLTCDPHGDRGSRLRLDFDAFVSLMRDGSNASGGLPFDNFFTGPGTFIARQIAGNDPYRMTFTWQQQLDSTAVISVPIPYGRLDEAATVFLTHFSAYEHTEPFAEECRRAGLGHGRLLDLNFLPFVVHGLLHRYRVLLDAGGVTGDFVVKARIDETWRCVPFLDVAEHAKSVSTHSVPVVQHSSVFAPPGVHTTLPLSRARRTTSKTDDDDRLVDTLLVFQLVATSLGVPIGMEGLVPVLPALLDRAREQQRVRTRRSSP